MGATVGEGGRAAGRADTVPMGGGIRIRSARRDELADSPSWCCSCARTCPRWWQIVERGSRALPRRHMRGAGDARPAGHP